MTTKPEPDEVPPAIPLLPASNCSDSERPVKVDMWDQECGSEGTVSNAIRRYTAQWGLPQPVPKSQNKERIAAKIAVTIYRANLETAIEAEDWATAGDVAAFLRLQIRQLELLDIQRKQENQNHA